MLPNPDQVLKDLPQNHSELRPQSPKIRPLASTFWDTAGIGKVVVSLAAAAAKSLQSCPTLCDPIDGSPPGSSVPGILQARTLEWVAISFSNFSSNFLYVCWCSDWNTVKMKVKSLSRVQLFATPWTVAHQAPPSMGVSRQEYWSGVPLPSPVSLATASFNTFSFPFLVGWWFAGESNSTTYKIVTYVSLGHSRLRIKLLSTISLTS